MRALLRRLSELKTSASAQLFAANVVAQLLALAVSPLLTRMYSSHDFGVLGLLTALATVLSPIASGRYELALPSARSDIEATSILKVCTLQIACVASAIGVAIGLKYFGHEIIPNWELSSIWWALPLAMGLVAFYDVLGIEASRQQHLRTIALAKVNQTVLGLIAHVTLGYWAFGEIGLIIGFLTNYITGCLILVLGLHRRLISNPRDGMVESRPNILHTAKKYRRFPLITSWSSALQLMARWAPQLLVTLLWGPVLGGYVFLVERIVGRPLALLSSSLLPVYVADVSASLREDSSRIKEAFWKALVRQGMLTLSWTVCIVMFSPFFIVPLFGEAWAPAIPYVQALSVAMMPFAWLHAVTHTLQLLGHQATDAKWSVLQVCGSVCLLTVAKGLGATAIFAIWLYAAAQFVFATFLLREYLKAIANFRNVSQL